MLAGRAVGLWNDKDLAALPQPDRRFLPQMDQAQRNELMRQWQRAVERSRSWAKDE